MTIRQSILNIPHDDHNITFDSEAHPDIHVDLDFCTQDCAITSERLNRARISFSVNASNDSCALSADELHSLQREQSTIRKTLMFDPKLFADIVEEVDGDGGKDEDEDEDTFQALPGPSPPQDAGKGSLTSAVATAHEQGRRRFQTFINAKIRSRFVQSNDGVLGVQGRDSLKMKRNSIFGKQFTPNFFTDQDFSEGDEDEEEGKGEAEEAKACDIMDVSFVRKPNLGKIVEEYDRLVHHPKYSLKQILLSRRFHLYKHRFGNAQYKKTLLYPTLPQPKELFLYCGECKEEPTTEKFRKRPKGHRFIITADTQYGILMDGFAMESPNWSTEIEISRKCVEQINEMTGDERPLFVCICGDLVDTESSFSGAIASWKKVMQGWERNLVFDQQCRDFKRVWANLDPDIALVCLCGNHDVGNRPTKDSIQRWSSAFGDDYLSFWVNGTFNICLNSCLFSNPSGAQDLYEEQLAWMEGQLKYARSNNATHIFVHGHFPWFLKHEEEGDNELNSYSDAPPGWGPPGSRFEDGYFTVPYAQRKPAMELFKKYDVTACFSGHFHQNVVTQTSWGMPMIVTGPLSMNLKSEISHELANGEVNGIGMRIVDVGERGEFTHKWILLDDEDDLYAHALELCENEKDLTNALHKWHDEMIESESEND